MRQRLTMIYAAVLVGSLAACAATPSQVRVDKAADFDAARCSTFDWLPQTNDAASLTDQRVRTAALETLERKGYTRATENPDCRISYVFSAYERPQEKPRVGVGAGGGSGGIGGGIGVSLPIGKRDRFGGTLTLDIIDASEKAQIWSGSLDASFQDMELTEEDAQAAVAKVLSEFPDKK